jgi:hypothetical protein
MQTNTKQGTDKEAIEMTDTLSFFLHQHENANPDLIVTVLTAGPDAAYMVKKFADGSIVHSSITTSELREFYDKYVSDHPDAHYTSTSQVLGVQVLPPGLSKFERFIHAATHI